MRSDELEARRSIPGWVLLLALGVGVAMGAMRACDGDDGGTRQQRFVFARVER